MGGLLKRQKQLRFLRNPNGRLNEKTGKYGDKKQWSKFKYANQIRISCGCGLRIKAGGGFTGHRLPTYDYTGCWIHTLGKYNDLYVPAQIHRIKTKGARHEWTEGERPADDVLYMDDPITRIKGIKQSKAAKLTQAGVTHVKDMHRSITDPALQQQILRIRGIARPTLCKWQDSVRNAREGAYVSRFVDHRRADNPYISKYGENWERHIATDLRKAPHRAVSIKELVWHMYSTSKDFFADTEHKDDWFFYHDALTQLTDKECRNWMKAEGIYKHWLIPVNGCCAGTIYFGRSPGNTPEVMPWDEDLNHDLHDKVRDYACLSRFLKEDEHPELWKKRFCLDNQRQMLDSYLRVLDPDTGVAPSSERIVQDFTRCWGENLDKIVAARGCYVPDIGHRKGHRADGAAAAGVNKRGGKREKNAWEGFEVMHADAKEIWDLRRQLSNSTHRPTP